LHAGIGHFLATTFQGWAEVGLAFVVGPGISAEDVVHVRATPELVLAGTSEGRVCWFDRDGCSLGSCVVGRGPAWESASDGGDVNAVYCAGVLTRYQGTVLVQAVRMPCYFANLAVQGKNVLIWEWNRAWLVNGGGDLLWRTEFGRRIGSAFADEAGFSILAGPLYRYGLHKNGA